MYITVFMSMCRLNHWLHGVRAAGFHMGNVVLYGVTVLAVYALAIVVFDHWGGVYKFMYTVLLMRIY